ncbi:MAG: 6,7-dimethyl-8-ribityllumazine synthase [Gemmatimonadaceae bacterium]|nr:6,7-dimethyl-8-ribityllumazine synthase [Gemmatimonadaceae bacterium]
MAEFNGDPSGEGRRIAVVVSRFNEEVTTRLLDGAMKCLLQHGVKLDDIDVAWVPGAWELPLAAAQMLASERYDALVAVGAVIRGETPHFDYVAGAAATGLAAVQREYGMPVGFGVITTNDDAQAEARSGGAHGNKGWEAALAALEMAGLLSGLDAIAGQFDEPRNGATD